MKTKTKVKRFPEHWEVSTSVTINGRTVEPGTELTITDHVGPRKRCRFLHHVRNGSHEWVTVAEIDRASGRAFTTRSFALDRVRTVHRKEKGR